MPTRRHSGWGSALCGGCRCANHRRLRRETNQTPGLAVTLLPGELVGHEQVVRELIRSGTNEFMFVVPDGLRTDRPPEGTIVLTSRDMKYYVSLRIAGLPPTNPGLKEAMQEQIASQYPGAEQPGGIYGHRGRPGGNRVPTAAGACRTWAAGLSGFSGCPSARGYWNSP